LAAENCAGCRNPSKAKEETFEKVLTDKLMKSLPVNFAALKLMRVDLQGNIFIIKSIL